jgi:hypothetical protein
MKTNLILVAVLLLSAIQGTAQRFYVGANGGYAIPFLKQFITTNETNTTNSSSGSGSSSSTAEASKVYGNFGSGANIGITAGYFLTTNLAAELGYTYFMTGSIKATYKSTDFNNGTITNQNTQEITFNSSLYCFSGGIKYAYPQRFGTIYSRAGLLLAKSEITYDVNSTNSGSSPSSSRESSTTLSGPLYMGGYASLGFQKSITPVLSVFGEVTFQLLQFTPQKSAITKLNVNGQDQLSSLTTRDKEISYEESYTSSSTDPNSPRKGIIQGMNFSSVGVKAGVIYTFGSSK